MLPCVSPPANVALPFHQVSALSEDMARASVMGSAQLAEAQAAKEQLAALREAHTHLRVKATALEEDAAKAQRAAEEARRQTAPLHGRIE